MKVFYGAIIYAVWSILIGFFVPSLAVYSTMIAAFSAGIYVGYGNKTLEGLKYGSLTGLIGGILGGITVTYLPNYIPNIGIPLKVYVSYWFTPMLGSFAFNLPQFSIFVYLSIMGLIFGGIGGTIGSIKMFKGILLFITLFVLFIIYGAFDNMAWNWGKWPWYMSFQHVLTNSIDLFVAVIFALFVTILYYLLE